MNMDKKELNSSKDWSHCISTSNQNSRSSSDWSPWEKSDRVGNSPKDGHGSNWGLDKTADTRIACSETFSGSNCSGPSVRPPQEDTWGQSSGNIEKTADAKTVNVGFSGYDLPRPSVGHPQNDTWNQIHRDLTNSWKASEDTSRGWSAKQSWDIERSGCRGQDVNQSESHGEGFIQSANPTTSPVVNWTNSWNGSEDPGSGWGGNQSWSHGFNRSDGQDVNQIENHGRGCIQSQSPTKSTRDNWKPGSYGGGGRKDGGLKKVFRLCRDFASGRCRWGSRCKFLHDDNNTGPAEVGASKHHNPGGDRAENFDLHDRGNDIKSLTRRKSTTICRDYAAGKCRWGSSCRFLHPGPSEDREDRSEHNIHTENSDKHDRWNRRWGRTEDVRGGETEFGTGQHDTLSDKARWSDVAASVKTTGSWGSRGNEKSNASHSSTSGEFVKDKWVETLAGNRNLSEDAVLRERGSGRDKHLPSHSDGEKEGFSSKFIKSQSPWEASNNGGTIGSFPVSARTSLHTISEAVQGLNGRIVEASKLIPTAPGFTGSCTYAASDINMTSLKWDGERIEDADLCSQTNTLATDAAFNSPVNVKRAKQDNGSVRKARVVEHIFPHGVGDVHTQGSEGHPMSEKQYVSHTNEVHKSLENERGRSVKPQDLIAKEGQQMHELCEGSVDMRNLGQDEKETVMFRMALVEFVKDILKPMWKEGKMSREVHKIIVKKVVEKVTGSVHVSQAPKTRGQVEQYMSFCEPKLTKLVQDYVERYLKPS